ncbi:MAG: Spy/CpxP family protein refolding chaperone [Mariprofundus sp.]
MNQLKINHSHQSIWMLLMILAVCLSLPGISTALAGGGGERHMKRLAEQLNLTDEQRQKFKQIHRNHREAGMVIRDALHDNRQALARLDPGAGNYQAGVEKLAEEQGRLVKRMVIHKSKIRAKIYAVLTPSQREKAIALKKQHRRDGKHHGHGGHQDSGSGHDPM